MWSIEPRVSGRDTSGGDFEWLDGSPEIMARSSVESEAALYQDFQFKSLRSSLYTKASGDRFVIWLSLDSIYTCTCVQIRSGNQQVMLPVVLTLFHIPSTHP